MKQALIFVGEMYEDLELWVPKIRLEEDKIQTVVAGEKKNFTYTGYRGYPCKSDTSFEEVSVGDFDGLVIPGGYAPDKIRRNQTVLSLVKEFHSQGKMIGFICHAGSVLISAKVLKGVQVTGTSAIKDDLENAGAIWKDEPLVIDRHFISSRTPKDLPVFGKALSDFIRKVKS